MHPLFVHAAPIEAGPLPETAAPAEFLCLGVGKAASAATLATRLATDPRPGFVVLFGICGAHTSHPQPLEIGELCLVAEDSLADEGVRTEQEFVPLSELGLGSVTRFAMDARLTEEAAEILGCRIVQGSTVSSCSGNDTDAALLASRTGAAIESMEGASVALACEAATVPLVQLRCVSNRTGDRARGGWDVPGSCAILEDAVRKLTEANGQGIWPA